MQISKRTIISTVINLIALINTVMIMIGKPLLNITDNEVTAVVTVAFTVAAWVYGFWKNNSFTKPAIKADEYLDLLRNNEWLGESTDEALYYEDDDEPEEEDGDEKTN